MSNGIIEVFYNGRLNNNEWATFSDDDENIAFIQELFIEAVLHFIETDGDPIHIYPYTVEEIELRLDNLKKKFLIFPQNLSDRINVIINFIKRKSNENKYLGVKVYV